MNIMVLCDSEKQAYDTFFDTIKRVTPIKVNTNRKKIIFQNDVYSFSGQNRFETCLKETFTGLTISCTQFYQRCRNNGG